LIQRDGDSARAGDAKVPQFIDHGRERRCHFPSPASLSSPTKCTIGIGDSYATEATQRDATSLGSCQSE
jgi:hypothetical protein